MVQTQQLTTVIEQAKALSAKEQLILIAQIAQNIEVAAQNTESTIKVKPQEEKPYSVTELLLGLSAQFAANVPKEELEKLPRDGAEQHDHYIYGTPKIEIE